MSHLGITGSVIWILHQWEIFYCFFSEYCRKNSISEGDKKNAKRRDPFLVWVPLWGKRHCSHWDADSSPVLFILKHFRCNQKTSHQSAVTGNMKMYKNKLSFIFSWLSIDIHHNLPVISPFFYLIISSILLRVSDLIRKQPSAVVRWLFFFFFANISEAHCN